MRFWNVGSPALSRYFIWFCGTMESKREGTAFFMRPRAASRGPSSAISTHSSRSSNAPGERIGLLRQEWRYFRELIRTALLALTARGIGATGFNESVLLSPTISGTSPGNGELYRLDLRLRAHFN